jgi:pimeloyl-ACP methyl ester carboxylesterase
MKLLLAIAALALLAAAAVLCAVWAFQGRLLYFPEPVIAATPSDLDLRAEEVLDEKGAFQGWFFPCGEPGAISLVFFHGNGGNVSHLLPLARDWVAAGFDVLLVEYAGYGARPGWPSEAATFADAERAWRFLTETRRCPPERIALWGHSLGGGVAVWLAARVTPGALVLDSTFTSVADRGAEIYPFLPVRGLCRNRYDTLSRVGGLRCPVIVAHSRTDEVIPFAHGERLFAAAKEPRRFVELRGGHNDSDGPERIPAILREVLGRDAGGRP